MLHPIPFIKLNSRYLLTTPSPTSIAAFSTANGELLFSWTIPPAPLTETEKRQQEQKAKKEAEKAARKGNEEGPSKEEEKEVKAKKTPEDGWSITALETSPEGEVIVVSSTDKQVFVIGVSDDAKTISVISQNVFPKRPCTMYSLRNTSFIGDKFGDVYSLSHSPSATPTLLLGHVSMLLTVTTTKHPHFPNRRLLITADRDEHIRISRYPQSHVTEGFCLGHTGFVSCLLVPNGSSEILFSAAGDGEIRVWKWLEGKCEQVTRLEDVVPQSHREGNGLIAPRQIVQIGEHIFVLVDKLPALVSYKFDSSQLTFEKVIELPGNALTMASHNGIGLVSLDPESKEDGALLVQVTEDGMVKHDLDGIRGVEDYTKGLGGYQGGWGDLYKGQQLRKFEGEESAEGAQKIAEESVPE